MCNKRNADRLYSHEAMEYRINGNRAAGNFFVGVTDNVSKSGACLYLMDEVRVGDRIALSFSPASCRQYAVVKWVKKVQDDFYLAGLMFA